jgi:hypothetical protein
MPFPFVSDEGRPLEKVPIGALRPGRLGIA